MEPPSDAQALVGPAIRVLATHPDRMNAPEALEMLPGSTPHRRAWLRFLPPFSREVKEKLRNTPGIIVCPVPPFSWIRHPLRAVCVRRRTVFFSVCFALICHVRVQIVRHLRRAENLQVREEFLRTRYQRIYIDRDTACPRCHKKIGKSAFARYPNGVVVHYICSDDKYVCPVTNKRFGPRSATKSSDAPDHHGPM